MLDRRKRDAFATSLKKKFPEAERRALQDQLDQGLIAKLRDRAAECLKQGDYDGADAALAEAAQVDRDEIARIEEAMNQDSR